MVIKVITGIKKVIVDNSFVCFCFFVFSKSLALSSNLDPPSTQSPGHLKHLNPEDSSAIKQISSQVIIKVL
jgi:hypothetical protein